MMNCVDITFFVRYTSLAALKKDSFVMTFLKLFQLLLPFLVKKERKKEREFDRKNSR